MPLVLVRARSKKERFNALFKRLAHRSSAGVAPVDVVPAEDDGVPSRSGEAGSSSVADGEMAAAPESAGGDKSPQKPAAAKKQPMSLRRHIYATLEDPSYSELAKWTSVFMMVIILLSTVCFVLESEAENPDGIIDEYPATWVFYYVEWVSVVLFTLEYCVRLVCCAKPLRFIIGVQNMIDLAAWLPFWLLLPLGSSVTGFGFVRAVRLIRVFRVFKFGKYSMGIQMFAGALKNSTQPMGILVVVVTIAMVILSSIMYMVEMAASDELLYVSGVDPEHQRFCFGTIPSAFWWSLVTMTTVGYGDCYPSTVGGKLITVIAMIGGVLILALPITVVGSNFAKMVEMFEEDQEAYQITDMDNSGLVDEYELREFLLRKRKEGALRKDIDTRAHVLLAKYDPEGTGELNMEQFRQLQNEVVVAKVADPAQAIVDIHRMVKESDAEAQDWCRRHDERLAALESAVSGLCQRLEAMTGADGVPGRPLS